jgi:hypothetical protein
MPKVGLLSRPMNEPNKLHYEPPPLCRPAQVKQEEA